MRAGQLRHQIRFEKRGAADEELGTEDGDWTDFAPPLSVRAAVKALGGNEAVRADRVSGQATYEIVIRSSARTRDVTAKHRAVNARTSEIYRIHAIVDPKQDRRWLVLTCSIVQGDV